MDPWKHIPLLTINKLNPHYLQANVFCWWVEAMLFYKFSVCDQFYSPINSQQFIRWYSLHFVKKWFPYILPQCSLYIKTGETSSQRLNTLVIVKQRKQSIYEVCNLICVDNVFVFAFVVSTYTCAPINTHASLIVPNDVTSLYLQFCSQKLNVPSWKKHILTKGVEAIWRINHNRLVMFLY